MAVLTQYVQPHIVFEIHMELDDSQGVPTRQSSDYFAQEAMHFTKVGQIGQA